jgi:signal transduction histidine kinase/ligand-binding sensor domain-containing protein
MQASRNLQIFFALVFKFFVSGTCVAQTEQKLDFELLNGSDGLSQGLITQIIQDRTGLMWFGTNDGLNKYDGYEFTVYRHKSRDTKSIADDAIRSIFEDSKGRLWIGTAFKGLELFDRRKGRFIHIRNPQGKGAPSNYVRSMTEDRQGKLWVCTSGGLYRLSEAETHGQSAAFQFSKIDLPPGNSTSFYRLHMGRGGAVFLVSARKIWEIVPDKAQRSGYRAEKRFAVSAAEADDPSGLMEDPHSGAIYWLAGKAIWKFENSDFEKPRRVYTSSTIVKAGIIDSDRRLWIEDKSQFVLLHTRNDSLEHVGNDPSLQPIVQNTVCHYQDRTGTIWFGTFGYGILRYNPDKTNFHHILPDVNAYPIVSTPTGEVIVNALAAFRIDRKGILSRRSLQAEIPETGLHEPFMAIDRSGNYWFIAQTGVFLYRPETGEKRSYELAGMGKLQVFPPYLDPAGTLWMASSRFLIAFDTQQRTFRTFSMPLKPTSDSYSLIEAITSDRDGVLWLATVSGLLKFDVRTNNWKTYTFDRNDPESLSTNQLLCVYNDTTSSNRYLWIGTKGAGLERFDKVTGKFTHYNDENGLPNNVVYGILPDKGGDLWVSTNNGLSRLVAKGNTFQNFTTRDGLQDNEFNRYAFHKRGDTLFFGGLKGLNYFIPEQIKAHGPPTVFFSGFKLFNRTVDITQPNSPLKADISYVKEIRLLHSQNMIGLKFAVADYRQVGQVKYRYMLEGFDKQWIQSGTAHEATYTNLDPGRYRFLVAASYDGVAWGQEPASISIRIIPPWWNSWWFFALLAMAFAAGLYAIYRYRLMQLMRVQNIRNTISRDLHDEIGSTLSTITIYAKVGSEQLKQKENALDSILEKIRLNASQAQEAMHDIIWSTNTDNDQFQNIINYMRGYANQLCDINGYRLTFLAPDDTPGIKLDMVTRREFYLIFKEALNNIMKHSGGNEVSIEISVNSPFLKLDICDNGKGFGNKNGFREGNGLGNMRSRAQKLRGTFEITSIASAGTAITLRFPIH